MMQTPTRWTHALDAAERGPWARLRDTDKAARRATGLAARAGWLPHGEGGPVEPGQRGLDGVRAWLEGLNPATARDYVRRARQALEAAGLGSRLRWPEVRGTGRRRERALDPTETAALLAAFEDPVAASLARWLLLTGSRPGEARAARWRDLDVGVSRRVWRVRGTKTEAARRVLPLDDAHVEALPEPVRLREEDELVWPISDWAWRKAWAAAVKGSRLPSHDLVPYCLRHTFATRALERGMTYEQVAAWLGHTSGDTLRQHYRHAVAPVGGVGDLLGDLA